MLFAHSFDGFDELDVDLNRMARLLLLVALPAFGRRAAPLDSSRSVNWASSSGELECPSVRDVRQFQTGAKSDLKSASRAIGRGALKAKLAPKLPNSRISSRPSSQAMEPKFRG